MALSKRALTTLMVMISLKEALCSHITPTHANERWLLEDDIIGCESSDKCLLCDENQQTEEACKLTGRIQKYECRLSNGETTFEWKSCNRTQGDEQFLMIRMEVVCLVFGGIAFMSTRRQKAANASLFEQRRRGGKRSSSILPVSQTGLEMAVLNGDDDEEIQPLKSEPLDVV